MPDMTPDERAGYLYMVKRHFALGLDKQSDGFLLNLASCFDQCPTPNAGGMAKYLREIARNRMMMEKMAQMQRRVAG